MDKAKTSQPENIMGTMKVNRLLLTMSIPMVISMLVQALYNIVDSMFVAQINENALTAVSLAFPLQNLMIAVGTGTGVGVNALLSKSLGEKNMRVVNQTASNSIFLALCSFVLFLLLGLFGSHQFFLLQTSNKEIVNYGTTYLTICTSFSFGLFVQLAFERLLQSTGKTFYTMITQGLGAIIKRIYSVGVPSIILSSISSVMTFGMNKILILFSSTATAAFGVYFKLQSFVFMPVFGLNNGAVPIIAYNYGAKKPERIMKTLKLSICYATIIMLIGIAAFQLFPETLLNIFNASEYMMEIGVPMLRTISISFLFAGFCIVCMTLFQALSHGFLSLIASGVRQLIVLLPVAYFFAQTRTLEMVWWAFPIAEIFSVILCIFGIHYVYKRNIQTLVK